MSFIHIRFLLVAGATALCGLHTLAALAQPQPSESTYIAAQWQPFDVRFHYFGFTTYYSCDGLENRLEQILKELGADQEVRVSVSGCAGFNSIDNMLSARITGRMPAVSDASGETFAAISKAVTLQTHSSGSQVGSGDCELLEQVRDKLLPALKLQAVTDSLRCTPGMTFGSRSLQVRALVVAPATTVP
jgi:hypothetical protein